MKVQYIKEYTDADGRTFKKGWTAEHTDAEGQRRIDAGVCCKVPDISRARRAEIVYTECVPEEPKEQGQELTNQPKASPFKSKK